jgi:hypothetical protein
MDFRSVLEGRKTMAKVRFEKCACDPNKLAHGYFHDDEKGKADIPNMSVETAKSVLEGVAKERGLSPEEVAEVEAQISAAGLPEVASEAEKELVALAELSAQTGIPIGFLLSV